MDEELTFDLVLILGIGVVALVVVYYVKKALTSCAAKAVYQGVADTTVNAATGKLTQSQKDAIVQDNAAQLVKASNGKLTLAQAQQMAAADFSAEQALEKKYGIQTIFCRIPLSVYCTYGITQWLCSVCKCTNPQQGYPCTTPSCATAMQLCCTPTFIAGSCGTPVPGSF